jgi:hypothetical protein
MLDSRFKSICFVFSFIGREQGVTIVEEYDSKSLHPMLSKCHHHLHPLAKFESDFANINVDEDSNLDTFEQIAKTSEPTKELVNMSSIFKQYQVNLKEIKCFLQWWQKHESIFPTVGSFVCQILGTFGSQIEAERIFSLVEILTNLRRCRVQ